MRGKKSPCKQLGCWYNPPNLLLLPESVAGLSAGTSYTRASDAAITLKQQQCHIVQWNNISTSTTVVAASATATAIPRVTTAPASGYYSYNRSYCNCYSYCNYQSYCNYHSYYNYHSYCYSRSYCYLYYTLVLHQSTICTRADHNL